MSNTTYPFDICLYEEKKENRLDSFWYTGLIAKITCHASRRTIRIEVQGTISAKFDGKLLFDADAVRQAYMRNFTDKDIEKLELESCNWFYLYEIFGDNEEGLLDCAGSYDEAFEAAFCVLLNDLELEIEL